MTFFDAIILGIVEGVTEFLPISSTAHLIISSHILGLAQTDFLKSFEVVIQLGAIIAVVTLYWRSFLNLKVIRSIAISFVPTAILGLILYGTIKSLFDNMTIIFLALFIGGFALIIFERWHSSKGSVERTEMTDKDALIVGICQACAFIPGISRAAATIVGGLALGLSRRTIAEYSFLLAVPTMVAATSLDILKNSEAIFKPSNLGALAIGFSTSFVVAVVSIKLLLSYIRKHDFTPFGYYRVGLAVLGFLFLI